jgi:hypothetical protein
LKISNVQLQNAKSTGFSSGHQFREDPRLRLMSGFPTVGGKKSIPSEGLTRDQSFTEHPPSSLFARLYSSVSF